MGHGPLRQWSAKRTLPYLTNSVQRSRSASLHGSRYPAWSYLHPFHASDVVEFLSSAMSCRGGCIALEAELLPKQPAPAGGGKSSPQRGRGGAGKTRCELARTAHETSTKRTQKFRRLFGPPFELEEKFGSRFAGPWAKWARNGATQPRYVPHISADIIHPCEHQKLLALAECSTKTTLFYIPIPT